MTNEEVLKNTTRPSGLTHGNGGRRFDICLINPPYSGSTHLKFLEKTIEIADKVVSIQPLNKFKFAVQNKTKLPVKITDCEVINAGKAKDDFNISIWSDLGIFLVDENATYDSSKFTYFVENYNIFKKVQEKMTKSMSEMIKTKPTTKWPLRFFKGCYWDLGHNYRGCLLKYEDCIQTDERGHTGFISMNSENERHNLHKYALTKFFRYCVKSCGGSKYVPFLDDYTEEWTDKRLFDYFEFTNTEIETIENEMKNFYGK